MTTQLNQAIFARQNFTQQAGQVAIPFLSLLFHQKHTQTKNEILCVFIKFDQKLFFDKKSNANIFVPQVINLFSVIGVVSVVAIRAILIVHFFHG